MKLSSPIHGRAALLDLIIVILVGYLGYLLYTKGRIDQYLPEEYRYSVRYGGGKTADPGLPAEAPVPVPPSVVTSSPAATPQAARPAPTTTTPVASAPAPVSPAPAAATPAKATFTTLEECKTLPRNRWPSYVAIKKELELPIVSNGRKVGSMTARPGTMFELVDIRAPHIVVKAGEDTQTLPGSDTDVLARFQQVVATN